MPDEDLKVATNSRGVDPKIEKIRRFMQEHPEGGSPQSIANSTRLNVNTIKSILPKVPGIYRVTRGWYKVVNGGDGTSSLLTDWSFHNCIMSVSLFQWNGITIHTEEQFGLLKFEYIVAGTGKATLRFSSDFPMNVTSIECMAALMIQKLRQQAVGHVTTKDILVSSIEFNKDYTNLRLDGLKSVSVDSLTTQFKLYQKTRGLRVEHKTKVPLSVESVVDMLTSSPNAVDFHVKLNQQKERLERLTGVMKNNTELLLKLIDKFNERR